MKKLLTILPILLISIGAMAQNKPVEAKKPGIIAQAGVLTKTDEVDTLYHIKPAGVFNRAFVLKRAALIIKNPDDYSVNEKAYIKRWADSLSIVDGTWYNGVKGVKK